uniref:RecF/RecN/SMC N-terminal domain-containing protein n=1 Tax=Cucumis melo TaxID=3656 RepID=A0A9I9EJ05_CUCME
MPSLDRYRRKVEVYDERVEDLNTVTQQRDAMKKQYDELKKKRQLNFSSLFKLDEFMSGFNTISLKLKEMYQMITLGGDAELELVDSLDPFSEGVVFSVRPPKKSWKNIANLSGGEKTLSSLALVFALHHYKPTPLYVMDEIDAALDFKNVSIVGHYVKDRTKDAQFIIIRFDEPAKCEVEQSNNEILENNLGETQIEIKPVTVAAAVDVAFSVAMEKLLQNLQKSPIYPIGVVP